MYVSKETLIRIATDNFTRVTELAASHRPGCRLARERLAEAAKDGLDKVPYLFVARVGMTGGWVDDPFVGGRIGCVPRIAPMF